MTENAPMTTAQVAGVLGVSKSTAQRLAKAGTLPAERVPGYNGDLLFDREAVMAYAEESRGTDDAA